MRTARANGLSPRTVIVTYAFRNAMLPVVTTLGMVFSFLLGANVLVEKVFAWPGIGSYAVEALIASDFAPVQGFVLTMAILYVVLNLIDRHSLRRDRSAREDRRHERRARPSRADRAAGAAAGARRRRPHARTRRYVSAENPVTGFAFALFVADRRWRRCSARRSCRTIRSPATPPSPCKPPSAAHWFGTDQLGRDIFSRVIVATRLDLVIAVASVALVFAMGGLAGVAAGFFGGWTDRIVGRIADTIMAFPLFVLAMGIVAALGNTVHEHRHRHRDHQLPALCPRRARRGQRPPRRRLRAGGAAVRQRRMRASCWRRSCPTSCRS